MAGTNILNMFINLLNGYSKFPFIPVLFLLFSFQSHGCHYENPAYDLVNGGVLVVTMLHENIV